MEKNWHLDRLDKVTYKFIFFINIMYDYGAILWLITSCVLVRFMYRVMHKYVLVLNGKYTSLPEQRQMYIQKNLVKSSYLALLTIYAIFEIVWPVVQLNTWDNYVIHRLAAMYVSNDVVGLVCVNGLPKTTRIHHLITTVLVFISFGLDFQHSEIAQAMLVYTMSSAAAYIVNFHLGVRWLCARDELKCLRYSAGCIYTTACGVAWSWHLAWITTRPSLHIYHFIYLFLLAWIVRDDIILMRWLMQTPSSE